MREEMPLTAAWVDELRQALGSAVVDAAIRAGQKARRQYEAVQQAQGDQAAARWLKQQRFPSGCFFACENGHTVGIRRGDALVHEAKSC